MDRILGYIGSYFVKLSGQVDAVVFAGGIGEKSTLLRKTIIEKAQCLGFAIDNAANEKGPADDQAIMDISKKGGNGPRVLICQTDEQVSLLVFGILVDWWLTLRQCSMRWHIVVSRLMGSASFQG